MFAYSCANAVFKQGADITSRQSASLTDLRFDTNAAGCDGDRAQ